MSEHYGVISPTAGRLYASGDLAEVTRQARLLADEHHGSMFIYDTGEDNARLLLLAEVLPSAAI